ncbi:GDYXXLXY domain-containing protein [Hymenobacter setariae]|uniref:GDYXXLXY domain-containing protein n=1 Tax=Hymenobacter setariae TaxID=2594794 RepID=A0A558BUD9_9BACT|nr:GDYXXLXY domain-containing protein [Hymenobacter setariae]TVT40134.1 GDYXXLXY domain-containing protein [Hymenobacter setariae]
MPTSSTPSHRMLVRLLVAAQLLYVLGVAGAGYATTAYGQHIALATSPVDLHSLQYESFVRLRYTIAEAPLTAWRVSTPPQRRQSVYVLLNTGADSLAAVAGVYDAAPRPAAGQAVLRGWVTDVFPRTLGLRYNLERYYVPGDSPLRLGKTSPAVRVQVSIAPWGQARIESVRLLRPTAAR